MRGNRATARVWTLLAVLLAALLAAPSLVAVDYRQGLVQLTLHEQLGRFTLSVRDGSSPSGYRPLFFDDDPRTSVLAIAVGNRVFRLGESSSFEMTVSDDADAPGFVWTSQQLEVAESFEFISSAPGRPVDGVRVTLSIRNVSEEYLEVGARYIFDTNLGEDGSNHFSLSNGEGVSRELAMRGSSTSNYWASGPQDGSPTLLITANGAGTTRPDRVVFANWKRLSDVSWTYETSSNRNFNLPPFSIGDSAASHYYGPGLLARGATLSIQFVVGQYQAGGFAAASTVAATTDSAAVVRQAATASATTTVTTGLALTASVDLVTVQAVIAELNRYLESGTDPSAADLEAIRTALSGLRATLDAESR